MFQTLQRIQAGLEKKNLFRTLTTGATVGGVTLTVNDDGSVTLNGDVPSDTNLSIALTGAEMYDSCKHIPNGNYILCSNSNTGVIVEVTGYQFEPDGILSRAYAFAHNGEEKSFVMNDELWIMLDYTGKSVYFTLFTICTAICYLILKEHYGYKIKNIFLRLIVLSIVSLIISVSILEIIRIILNYLVNIVVRLC